jgi:hypothetical protein
MQFRHATEELPFGEPLNVRSAWEVRVRAAICPCYCPLIGVLRSCPCSNLLADQDVMATAAISAMPKSGRGDEKQMLQLARDLLWPCSERDDRGTRSQAQSLGEPLFRFLGLTFALQLSVKSGPRNHH